MCERVLFLAIYSNYRSQALYRFSCLILRGDTFGLETPAFL
jgi:hypothetical protein